jgi:hypothetical protein
MMQSWTIKLPVAIQVNHKTRFALNLNQYRNAHFHVLNKAKSVFHTEVGALIKHLPYMDQAKISYVFYCKTSRDQDVANVCSIVDKFFCDTLVDYKKLPDDSWRYVPGVEYIFGGIDPKDPRVEATVTKLGT